jgi:aspartyl-tRNA(Asn)/glutamyl-tRNA(Gln) amidotransferase subunit B
LKEKINLKKDKYIPVIGLEVHVQLNTESKLFCGCANKFTDIPNTNVCPYCLGHPGVLPVLNEKAVEYAVKMALAVNSEINTNSVFSRKNYFYPDLPKGYQITQYDMPFCSGGYINIRKKDNTQKQISIKRIHIEEDAAKSIHINNTNETLLDFNRSGVPLLEIVTEPVISSAEEAFIFLKKIHQLLRYLDISTGNMEEGAMRCDANISLEVNGKPGAHTEIKNLNSFKSVYDALESEIQRQKTIYDEGGNVIHATMSFSQSDKQTSAMRFKEEDFEYRYFSEPDLPPLIIDENILNRKMPELPDEKYLRFISEYSLPEDTAERLTSDKGIADYFENLAAEMPTDYALCANWMLSVILGVLNEWKIKIKDFIINESRTASLLKFVSEGKINLNSAKEVYDIMYNTGRDACAIIKEKDLLQITNESDIFSIVSKVIESNYDEFIEFKNGKEKLRGFFVGLIMKESKGKANTKIVNELINKYKINQSKT